MTSGELLSSAATGPKTDPSESAHFSSLEPGCGDSPSGSGSNSFNVAMARVSMWCTIISVQHLESTQEVPRIIAELKERARQFQLLPVWDIAHGLIAEEFLRIGEVECACDLLAAMHSAYSMADFLFTLRKETAGEDQDLTANLHTLGNYLSRRLLEQSSELYSDFTQACIDSYIEQGDGAYKNGKTDAEIAACEEEMRKLHPGYDPVTAWVASQCKQSPRFAWDTVPGIIADEELWQATPRVVRCYFSGIVLQLQEGLTVQGVHSDNLLSIASDFEALREHISHPQALDACYFVLGDFLAKNHNGMFAFDLVREIQNPLLMRRFADILQAHGDTEEAAGLRELAAQRAQLPTPAGESHGQAAD